MIEEHDNCHPHNFVAYRLISESFDRKVCTKCGIHPVIIPEDSQLYLVNKDGRETPLTCNPNNA